MPLELVAVAPREPLLREYEERPLEPGTVRVVTEFAAPKHGTELGMYRGTSPFSLAQYDGERRIFVPRESEASHFPMPLGNMAIGRITELGSGTERYQVGDRVFGHLSIRETHSVPEDRLQPAPEEISPEQIVCWDPAEFALGAIRDANIRLGDVVVVFGMGAIGLMVAQMAKLGGAADVIVVDLLENRRQLALDLGADLALNPTEVDVAITVQDRHGGRGADVAIEASGAYPALHEAIRTAGIGGMVTPLAFYQGEARGLRLGEEAHMNRVTLHFTRSITDPNRDHPLWDSRRIKEQSFALLRDGQIRVDGVIAPIVPLAEAADAYRWIDEDPGRCVKIGVTFQ